MAGVVDVVAAGALMLGAAVWIGGFVTIVMVSWVASKTLRPSDRIAFFRRLGRVYGLTAAAALVLVIAGGGVLVRTRTWNGALTAASVVTAALVVTTAVGVAQAHAMTRRRGSALRDPGNPVLAARVARGARMATLLRALIAALSLVLFALAAALAV